MRPDPVHFGVDFEVCHREAQVGCEERHDLFWLGVGEEAAEEDEPAIVPDGVVLGVEVEELVGLG